MEWDVSVRTGGKGPWPQPTDGQLLQEVGGDGGMWVIGEVCRGHTANCSSGWGGPDSPLHRAYPSPEALHPSLPPQVPFRLCWGQQGTGLLPWDRDRDKGDSSCSGGQKEEMLEKGLCRKELGGDSRREQQGLATPREKDLSGLS